MLGLGMGWSQVPAANCAARSDVGRDITTAYLDLLAEFDLDEGDRDRVWRTA